MARKKASTGGASNEGEGLRTQRLELIKKRHRELILNPREGLMDGLLDDEDAFHSLEDSEEYQLIEDYELQPEF